MYGQTSSGKTHTMQGEGDDLGIVPQGISYVFDQIKERGARQVLSLPTTGCTQPRTRVPVCWLCATAGFVRRVKAGDVGEGESHAEGDCHAWEDC